MVNLKKSFLSLLLLSSSLAFAGVSLDSTQNSPASDLTLDGNSVLSLYQLSKMQKEGFDLSKLNPLPSDIWKSNYTNNNTTFDQSFENLNYVSSMISRLGNFRFNVEDENGEGYIILASKKAHNTLLRASLLKKLGYRIPKIEHVPKLKINFKNAIEKKTFIEELGEATFGSSSRWVVEESEDSLLLQDLVIMEANPSFYNLAIGAIPNPTIKGRRVLNSLLVPFALTDVPESINLFSVQPATISNNAIHFMYEDGQNFYPSLDDTKWITSKIAALSEADLFAIAEEAKLPLEVTHLLFHKLKCRRDDLVKRLSIAATPLGCTPNVSLNEKLQDGKLLPENYEGYASRFSYGDPESPLKLSEIWAYFKSKALSNIISNATGYFNENYLKAFNLDEAIYNHRNEVVQENYNQFIQTGELKKIPFGLWATPILNGSLITSREIMLGSYMGTDNLVQLADTVGFAVMGGVYIGVDGASFKNDGSVRISISRTYTHLTPMKTMKRALKEPFKNLLVSLHKRKIGHLFDDLENGNNTEEKEKRLLELLKEFKEKLTVGESFIIADNLIPEFNWRATLPIDQLFAIQGQLALKTVALKRLHIYRKNETTLQIYRDGALTNGAKLDVAFVSGIPTVKLSWQTTVGKATIAVHSINLSEQKKDGLALRLAALRALFLENETELIEELSKPFKVTHHFSELKRNLSFLLWNWSWPKIADRITVTHPEGVEKEFYKYTRGMRSGTNFQDFVSESLNDLVSKEGVPDLKISISGSEDSGRTLFGSSLTRKLTYESEIINGRLSIPYLFVNYTWNGWRKSAKKFKRLIRELKEKYKYEFYHDEILGTTKALGLYSLNFNIYFYSKGIDTLLNKNKNSVREIFMTYGEIKNLTAMGEKSYEETHKEALDVQLYYFEHHRKHYFKALSKNDHKESADHLTKLFSIMEDILSIDGMLLLVGGKENIFITSRIDGFRSEDENGDAPIVSHTFGRVSDKFWRGPIHQVVEKSEMNESEFFANWIIGRL